MHRTSARTGRRALSFLPLVVLVLGTAGAAGASVAGAPAPATGPGTTGDPNSQAADAAAEQLIGAFAPGPTWTPVSSPPSAMLAQPMAAPATPNLVDADRLWTTPDPWQTVESWLSTHPPVGGAPSGTGTTSDNGVVQESDTEFSYPASGPFQSRQLVVSAAPLSDGASAVRVDAQVIWYPTRDATEVVPGGDDTVTVAVYEGGLSPAPSESSQPAAPSSPASSPAVSPSIDPVGAGPGSANQVLAMRTITDPVEVRRIAAWVDALPTAVPGARSCPADQGTAPQLDLVFSGPPGAPTVKVHDDTNGCGGVSFTLDGTTLVPLTDGGLFHRVDQLLGLDLPRIDGAG
ncbi:MAG: hypothetical protein ABSG81_16480 [Acidimicrobiales bacterium]|jgi:hypothetical protein